jgi:hypothetical protein
MTFLMSGEKEARKLETNQKVARIICCPRLREPTHRNQVRHMRYPYIAMQQVWTKNKHSRISMVANQII